MGKYCDDMIKSMEWALRTIYIRSISFQNMTSQNLIDTILKTLLDSKNFGNPIFDPEFGFQNLPCVKFKG